MTTHSGIDAVQSWLDLPVNLAAPIGLHAEHVDRMSLTAMDIDGLIRAHAPARANIAGALGQTAALAGDTAFQAAGSDRDKLTQVLIGHPITGATSILGLAMAATGYNPLLPDTQGNATAFFRYAKKVLDAPFFHLSYSDQKVMQQKTSNWDRLIGDISDLFEGVVGEDRSRIINGLKQLAHTATSTKDKTQTTNLFCQQVVAVDSSSRVTVGIYNSKVDMVEHDGKHTTRQADFMVNRVLLSFDSDSWPVHAGKVAAKKCTSVTEWLESADTLAGK